MSNYSGLNILKSKAKELAKKKGIKLTEALEAIAIDADFSNYHELSSVAKRFPLEPRLMKAAFGETHFDNVIFRVMCTFNLRWLLTNFYLMRLLQLMLMILQYMTSRQLKFIMTRKRGY